jgi:hypothetical protein
MNMNQRRRGTVYREPPQSVKRHQILDKVIVVMGYLLSCYIGFIIGSSV